MTQFRPIILGALFVVGLCSIDAMAQNEDGAYFMKICGSAVKSFDRESLTNEEAVESIQCTNYLAGFLDGHFLTNLKVEKKQICIDEAGVTLNQAVRIFVNFLRENPKSLNKRGRATLFVALKQAYPCPD